MYLCNTISNSVINVQYRCVYIKEVESIDATLNVIFCFFTFKVLKTN